MVIEKRNIAAAIVFSIITCGIYMIYWEYRLLDSLYQANNIEGSAGMDILLSIITCGLYGLYMLYKAGKMESSALAMYNGTEKDDSVLYVLLGVFGVGVVAFAILQSSINNEIAEQANAMIYDPQRRV